MRLIAAVLLSAMLSAASGLVFEGKSGPGKGKHIVLISGDEEYRSEEALPQLAKILSTHHGFRCTVLFAIDPADGTINPDRRDNIPGLEALASADLMTRRRGSPHSPRHRGRRYLGADRRLRGAPAAARRH